VNIDIRTVYIVINVCCFEDFELKCLLRLSHNLPSPCANPLSAPPGQYR
jgi:hypothetical protein